MVRDSALPQRHTDKQGEWYVLVGAMARTVWHQQGRADESEDLQRSSRGCSEARGGVLQRIGVEMTGRNKLYRTLEVQCVRQ